MAAHLILVFDAPLMSFGGETIDSQGVVRDFPARSMIAGLIGNALGYDRADSDLLDRLQERLAIGSARLVEGRRIRDFQTAKLAADDKGWTTRGRTEGRAGGAGTYRSPHIRHRDADADALVLVALRLDPADEAPALDDVAAALDRPHRPLFIGRKPFLPSRPLAAGTVEADDLRQALTAGRQAYLDSSSAARNARRPSPLADTPRAQWPADEERTANENTRRVDICDERSWVSGVHGGLRAVVEASLPAPRAGTPTDGGSR